MFDFVVFGPMIFGLTLWPAVFFWAIVVVLFVEASVFNQGAVAFFTLAVALVAAYLLGFWTIDFVYQNHRAFLWLLAFYVPIGVAVSTAKWWFYTTGVASKVQTYLADQTVQARKKTQTDADFNAFMYRVRDDLTSSFGELPPVVSHHKSNLIRWMAWWPFTIIGSLFDDILRRFFTAVYNMMGDAWQAISNHAFRNVQFQNPSEQTAEQIAARKRAA